MNTVVVGVDRSETAARAAVAAADLATATSCRLHVVMAVPRQTSTEVRSGTDSWRIDSLTQAEDFVSAMARRLGGKEATWSVHVGDPARAICAEAQRVRARYLVVGNRRTHGAARVLGSVAADVVHHASCHVLVANTTIIDLDDAARRRETGTPTPA